MSEFEQEAKKAESFAEEHPGEADKGIQEAGDFANRETGGKYQGEVQDATRAAEHHFSQDAGPGQSGQDQGGQKPDQSGQDSQGQSQH